MPKKGNVVYKPLGTSAPNIEYEDDESGGSFRRDFEGPFEQFTPIRRKFGLRQLRTLLYVLATVLFLIFMAQLSSNEQQSSVHANSRHNEQNTTQKVDQNHDIRTNPFSSSSSFSQRSTISKQEAGGPVISADDRPQYENYMSSVIHLRDQKQFKKDLEPSVHDDFHFPTTLPSHSLSAQNQSSNTWWLLNFRASNKYVTVSNYIRAMKSFNHNITITLSTQATTEFMYHILELCKRWDGPISVAVFCPGAELFVATTLIKYMRQCLPAPLSACIKDKVTWHLVFNKAHGPSPSAISYPKYHLDSSNYPLFVNDDQCPKVAGPGPTDSIRQFEEELKRMNFISPISYRQRFKLAYPINVLRNTARLAASTKYTLASDIELYPSINLVPYFANFMKNHNLSEEYPYIKKYIFTLPIFEVKSNVSAPKTKRELIKMMENEDAIFFHKWVCDVCQSFPNRLDWLQTDKFGIEEYNADEKSELEIFKVTQRDKSRNSWEPIFIGTNDDPLYDDRLTWEGRRDKMGQMYEMCLQNYYLFILGNAFLVHAPGIKHIDKNDVTKRLKYMRENNSIYDDTILRLREQYSNSSNIDKC